MKCYWVVLAGLSVAGCMASNGLEYESVSTTNLYHIARIRKGMSERQVLHIMHKPYSYESFQVENDIYDVWFYVTRPTGLDQTRMVPQNLTPLTFKNGILVGTGYYWYYYAMKEEASEVAAQAGPMPPRKTQEMEDTEFENALKTFPQNPTNAPQPPQTAPPPPQRSAAPALQQPAPTQPPPSAPPVKPAAPMPAQTTMAIPMIPFCEDLDFSRIACGMTETQVIKLMGKPMNYQTFEMGGDEYDVWFYETVPSRTGSVSIVPQNKTPLTFKNAFLVSMDEDYYFEVKHLSDCEKLILTSEETPPVPQEAVLPTAEISTMTKPKSMGPPSFIKPWKPNPLLGAKKIQLSKVQIGMTEAEVTHILGTPSTLESYQLNNDIYEVWFYEAAASKDKTMPLTFKNGVLAGTTADYYNQIKTAASQDSVDGYDRPAERMEEQESEQNFNYW